MTIGCAEVNDLLALLTADWRTNEDVSSLLAAHIRSCPSCHLGLAYSLCALATNDTLACEECRARFPDYYEATRPDYPLVEMSAVALIEVALHLGGCGACKEQYEALVLYAELEERDELTDM